jgi:hypothetical protein
MRVEAQLEVHRISEPLEAKAVRFDPLRPCVSERLDLTATTVLGAPSHACLKFSFEPIRLVTEIVAVEALTIDDMGGRSPALVINEPGATETRHGSGTGEHGCDTRTRASNGLGDSGGGKCWRFYFGA